MQSGQLSSCDSGLSPGDIVRPSTLGGRTPTSQHSGGDIATVITQTYRIKANAVLTELLLLTFGEQRSLSALSEVWAPENLKK